MRDNRVSIDYVALQAGKSHAMPTCHRNKRTSREQRGIVNTGGSLHTVKALAKPARQPLDHERSYGGGGSGGHHSRASDRLTSPCTVCTRERLAALPIRQVVHSARAFRYRPCG